jgi:F-type H+-transporting ATPase subunit gamma
MISIQANASRLADKLAAQLYTMLHTTDVANVNVVYAKPDNQQGYVIEHDELMPLDFTKFARSKNANPPLLNLPPLQLLEQLGGEYLYARLNQAIMHSYAAENAARLQTMTAARENIAQRLSALTLAERLARQEDITAEIIELASGQRALRASPNGEKKPPETGG